jgi:lysophospholipase L1-like esterase
MLLTTFAGVGQSALALIRWIGRPPRAVSLGCWCLWLAACAVFGALINPPPRAWLALTAAGLAWLTVWVARSGLAFVLNRRRRFGVAWLVTPAIAGLGFLSLLISDADSMTRSAAATRLGIEGWGRSAVEPVPYDRAAFAPHLLDAELGEAADAQVVFLGDSLTARWATEGKAAWEAQLQPFGAVQFGVGEERTQNLLWRVQNGQLGRLTPKVVVVLIGTNNLGHNTAEQTAEGITAVVEEVRARDPACRVLLLGILPRGHSPSEAVRAKLADVNARVADLAGGPVRFADVGGCLLDGRGVLSPEMAPDGLHLSPAGYDRLAAALRPLLEELLRG